MSYCEAAGVRAEVVPYEEADGPDTITCVKDDQQEVTSVPDTPAPPTLRTRTSRYGIDSPISELDRRLTRTHSPRWPREKSSRMGSILQAFRTYGDGALHAIRPSLERTICTLAKSRAWWEMACQEMQFSGRTRPSRHSLNHRPAGHENLEKGCGPFRGMNRARSGNLQGGWEILAKTQNRSGRKLQDYEKMSLPAQCLAAGIYKQHVLSPPVHSDMPQSCRRAAALKSPGATVGVLTTRHDGVSATEYDDESMFICPLLEERTSRRPPPFP